MHDYELFEEIPLSSRRHRLDKLEEEWGDVTQESLIAFSILYLNQILIYAKLKKREDFFACLTFPDISDYGTGEYDYMVPSFMVTRTPKLFLFLLKQTPVTIDKYEDIYRGFELCGVLDSFIFFEDFDRLTAVPSSVFHELGSLK